MGVTPGIVSDVVPRNAVYNESLAFAILVKLNEEFPRKMQLDELRHALSDFSSVPEEEWLLTGDALMLGRAKGKVLRHVTNDFFGDRALQFTDRARMLI